MYVRGEIGEPPETVAPILVRRLGLARPALTGIGVTSLASPDTLAEIKAVARRRAKCLVNRLNRWVKTR